MSAATDPEPGLEPRLGTELEQLRSQESALEERTRRVEISNPLALVLSFAGMAIAIGALIVALANRSDQTMMNSAMTGGITGARAPHSTTMMDSGSGMMSGRGSFTASQLAAGNRGTVYVNLGDYWVKPAVSSVRAGKLTFMARNVGRVPHELMVERAPIKMTAPNQPDEDAAQGMIDDMSSGQSGRMTVRLAPGRYVLFCNAPGHYAAGQHVPFTVTNS